jgi:hypothetical protein
MAWVQRQKQQMQRQNISNAIERLNKRKKREFGDE